MFSSQKNKNNKKFALVSSVSHAHSLSLTGGLHPHIWEWDPPLSEKMVLWARRMKIFSLLPYLWWTMANHTLSQSRSIFFVFFVFWETIQINLGFVWIELILLKLKTYCWNHCSKIIFKYVNSTVGPIFNEKVDKKMKFVSLWTVHGCTVHREKSTFTATVHALFIEQ